MQKPISTLSKDFDRISGLIRKEYPDACIVYIDKVSSPEVEKRFDEHVLLVSKRVKPNITELFHGTRLDVIPRILHDGFQIKFNKRYSYGKGIYLSSNPLITFGYAPVVGDLHHVLLCDAILGTSKESLKGSRELFDGLVFGDIDSVKSGNIYVIRHDNAVVPRFVIGFYEKPTKTW